MFGEHIFEETVLGDTVNDMAPLDLSECCFFLYFTILFLSFKKSTLASCKINMCISEFLPVSLEN